MCETLKAGDRVRKTVPTIGVAENGEIIRINENSDLARVLWRLDDGGIMVQSERIDTLELRPAVTREA